MLYHSVCQLEKTGDSGMNKRVNSLRRFLLNKLLGEGETIRSKQSDSFSSWQVPLWSVEDVVAWVSRAGFQEYSSAFNDCGVDGDMLLQLTDEEIKDDIGIHNGILRKRFIRELKELKKNDN